MGKSKKSIFKHPTVIAAIIGAIAIIIIGLINILSKTDSTSIVDSSLNKVENYQNIDSGNINTPIEIINDDKIEDNSQKINIEKISGDFVSGDKNVKVYNADNSPKKNYIESDKVESITIEARLTTDLKNGESLPPAKYYFTPANRVSSDFAGNAGIVRVDFQSPIYFRRLEDNNVTIINNYTLRNGSDIQHRPLTVLLNYDSLYVPIVTVIYGKGFNQIKLLEITIRINGNDIWYASYKYENVPFDILSDNQFGISLSDFKLRLKEYMIKNNN